MIGSADASRSNGYIHLCRCACGTEKLVQAKYLRNGRSKSCGCHGFYPGVKAGEYTVVRRLGGIKLEFECQHGVRFVGRLNKGKPTNLYCPCERGSALAKAKHKHGYSPQSIRTREYNTWRIMRQRCNNPFDKGYSYYGGRGIKVCERWNEFANFLADMGPKPPGYSIERVDVDGDYCPENCVWIPMADQSRNRTYCKWYKERAENLPSALR